MSNEEEKRCPLCAEEMDWTDLQFKPCQCGYQVCVWCWNHIIDMADKDATEGRCPACRTPYDKEKIVAMEANCERVAINSNRKQKASKAKPKTNEVKKDLNNVRVIQRKMAYVIGLPLSLADENLLQQKEYFAQYGKVTKISLSRTAGGAIQQFVNDTCSVYITYSKEEEAIRCIQSVHGFVLEGRFLRASFGTAKYCHAWLKNMNCTNPACLYLHCIGAEEDTFGKEEVAAMHTRNRVQQVAGNPHNLQRRSGSVLPPAVDEPYNSYSNSTSTERIMLKSALKDPAVTGGHLAPLPSKDKDLVGRAPATSFVDIVGRVRSSCPEGDANVAEDRRILNLSSKLSSMAIDSDNPLEAEHSDAMLYNVFPSSHLVNGVHSNREFKKPVRELTAGHASLMEKKSCLMLDSAGQVQNGPYWVVGEAGLSFDNPLLKDSDSLSQMTHLFPSSYPVRISEDSSNHVWRDRESSFVNDPYSDINNVHSNADEASIQFTGLSSKSRYGCNEPKFQKSAKSDRISSNSFSDEEIMEHLRRLDDGNTTNDEPSAFGTVESSIISNILSMDFDDSNHFSSLPQKMAGVFDETDRRSGTSWNFHNSDQSGVSFRQQDGLHNQLTELASISNVGQLSRQFSVLPEGRESKEQYLFKPQHQVSRAQCLPPPGFFASSRDPPPGFSISERKDQIINATSGSHLSKPNSFPNNYHYRTPSTDISQPDFYAKPTNGMLLNKLCLDTRSLPYISQTTPYQDDSKLWHLMQPQSTSHQDPKFSQNSYIQPQIPSSYHELRYSGQIGNGLLSLPHDIYGESYNSNNHSGLAQFSQQKLSNGHNISSYYQQAAGGEIQRRERSELNKLYSSAGYGDSIFQTPSSGDVYTKLYGMM